MLQGLVEGVVAEQPEDDLISVLVQAELADEEGVTHRISDAEICTFAMLLMGAGSPSTGAMSH